MLRKTYSAKFNMDHTGTFSTTPRTFISYMFLCHDVLNAPPTLAMTTQDLASYIWLDSRDVVILRPQQDQVNQEWCDKAVTSPGTAYTSTQPPRSDMTPAVRQEGRLRDKRQPATNGRGTSAACVLSD